MRFLLLVLSICYVSSYYVRPTIRSQTNILRASRKGSPGEISDVPTSMNARTIKEITKVVINLTILYVTINMKVQEVILIYLFYFIIYLLIYSYQVMAFYKKNNPSEATTEVDDDYITAANGIKYQNIKSGEDELREVFQPGDSVKIQPIVYYNGIKIDKKYGALLTPTEYIVPYTPDMQLHELTFLGYPYLHEALRLLTYLPKQSLPYLLTYLLTQRHGYWWQKKNNFPRKNGVYKRISSNDHPRRWYYIGGSYGDQARSERVSE